MLVWYRLQNSCGLDGIPILGKLARFGFWDTLHVRILPLQVLLELAKASFLNSGNRRESRT